MAKALDRIFDGYNSPAGRGKTLLVITDGVWLDDPDEAQEEREKDERVEQVLLKVTKTLHSQAKHAESRKVTIQFIRVGNHLAAMEKLKRLDDQLETIYKKRDFQDMVDHVPWTGPVHKMIVGSLDFREDKEDNQNDYPQPPNGEEIEQVCAKFIAGTLNSNRQSTFSSSSPSSKPFSKSRFSLIG